MHKISILSNRGKAHEINFSSRNVVFPAGRKNIDYQRILDCGGAVLNAPAHNESVPRAQYERFSLAVHFQMPTHNVDNLIVRMAVHRSRPTLHHLVLGEKELRRCARIWRRWDSSPPSPVGHTASPIC